MSEIVRSSFGPKFDELRARYVETPGDVDEYERTVRTVVMVRRVLMAIDSERQRLGISKAELARRIGADPSVVRRLLSNGSSNPTLKTVVDLLYALSIDVELRPAKQPPAPAPDTTKQKRRRGSTRGKAA